MKKRHVIIQLIFVLVCFAMIGFWMFRNSPSLEFAGYAAGKRVALFDLRNTTKRPIYIVNKYPAASTETYLKRPVYFGASGKHVGDESFLPGKPGGMVVGPIPWQIMPGEVFRFQIRLGPTDEPEQIGVRYYTGDFKDARDFYNKLVSVGPAAPANAPWVQQVKIDWSKLQRWLKRPRQNESWCEEVLQP